MIQLDLTPEEVGILKEHLISLVGFVKPNIPRMIDVEPDVKAKVERQVEVFEKIAGQLQS